VSDLHRTVDGERDPGTGPRRSWRLPAIPSSVPALRRRLNGFLSGADLSDDERYDLLLAACEAASNAIEHAAVPSEPFFDALTEIDEAGVTVSISDHGHWRDATPGTFRGRGLAMMRVLVDTTVDTGPQGTTVTLRSHRPAPWAPAAPDRHDDEVDGSAAATGDS